MRRILLCLLAAGGLSLAACSSNDFFRGRFESQGAASAQAFRVKNGAEVPVTDRYTVNGQGTATVQTIKPYLTLDGSWSKDQTPASGARVVEEPGAVLMRTAPAAAPSATPAPCPNGACPAVPSAAPCPPEVSSNTFSRSTTTEALAAADDGCGRPLYVGCGGTPGGTTPMPIGDLIPEVPPGSGWPCTSAGPVGDKILGTAALPVGILAHVGVCFYDFLRCVFSVPPTANPAAQ